MVDGGPGDWKMSDSYKRAAHCLFGAINTLGINYLDRLVVTHNDFDHTFGTYALLVSYAEGVYPLTDQLVNPSQSKYCKLK